MYLGYLGAGEDLRWLIEIRLIDIVQATLNVKGQ